MNTDKLGQEPDKTQSDKIWKIENYRKKNQFAKQGQIVCTGSSLMEMFPIEKFIEESHIDKIVYNRGIGGFITEELKNVLDVCVLDLHPSRVFINIGTNDLSDSRIPMETIMANYDEIISRIENEIPNVEIYLMAYYPVNFDAAAPEMKDCLKIRTNEKINAANAWVKKLAEKHGQRYIDINRNLEDEQGRLKAEYTIEGMHINEAGYKAIFEDFIKYVNEPSWK